MGKAKKEFCKESQTGGKSLVIFCTSDSDFNVFIFIFVTTTLLFHSTYFRSSIVDSLIFCYLKYCISCDLRKYVHFVIFLRMRFLIFVYLFPPVAYPLKYILSKHGLSYNDIDLVVFFSRVFLQKVLLNQEFQKLGTTRQRQCICLLPLPDLNASERQVVFVWSYAAVITVQRQNWKKGRTGICFLEINKIST